MLIYKLKKILEKENLPSLTDFAAVYFFMQKGERYQLLAAHKTIEEELLKIVFRISKKNLIICMPPRFGKSELVIRIFLSWCFIFMPNCNFILSSNTLELARTHVKAIRDTLTSDWYQNSFYDKGCARIKTTINDSKNKRSVARNDFFETYQGGSVKGIGMGGLITGFGAGKKGENFGGCIVCDDLLKEQDFFSQSKRDAVYQWMKSTIEARRNSSDTPIILVMQRLHEDDIVGRLLREEAEQWTIVKVSAFDETTQKSIWDDAISTETLLRMKNSEVSIQKYMFAAKYQQEPSIDLDATIKISWWKYYDKIEDIYSDIYHRIITMDTAYKGEDQHDESVMQLWGFSHDAKRAYLLDMRRGRWEFPTLVDQSIEFWNTNKYYIQGRLPQGIYVEDKASGPSLAQVIQKNTSIPIKLWTPPLGTIKKDKLTRVFNTVHFIADGRVFLPKNASFVQDFIMQCAAFNIDSTSHDDMVDAMTMALLIWTNFGAK